MKNLPKRTPYLHPHWSMEFKCQVATKVADTTFNRLIYNK